MRHHWCNFALMKEFIDYFLLRRMAAQRQSIFASKY